MRETNNKRSSYSTMVSFLCTLALAVSIFSCNSDRIGGFEHSGMLQFGIQADTSGMSNNQPVTKATVYPDLKPFLNTDLYKVEILQGAESTVIQTFDHYKDMPEQVELERGDYKIRASMGESKPAAFNSPRLEGVSDFIIKEDMTTKLDVTCSLVNARLTVAYTDSFKMVYPRYTAAFTSSHTTEPFKFVQNESRAGWFRVNAEGEDLTCILTATPDTGAVKQFTVKIPAVKPKDNVGLIFNSSQESRPDRGLTVKITINEETTEKPVYVYVPDYMLPVDGVSVVLKEFASGVPQPIKKGVTVNDYSVDIAAPGTIGKCLLSIVKKGGEPKTYDLANLSDADKKTLTEDEALVWDNMNAVQGKRVKTASIQFKKLVEKLQTQIPDKDIDLYDYTLIVSDSLKAPHTSEPKILKIKVYPDNAPLLTSINFKNSMEEVLMERNATTDYKVNIKTPNKMEKCMLTIYQDGKQVGNPHNLMESTPEGIVFNKQNDTDAEVSFKDLIPTLKAGIDSPIKYDYSLVVTDKFPEEPFVSDQMVLSLKITPYIKVYAPRGDIWTNRAKIIMELANNVTGSTVFEYRDENSSWMPITGDIQGEGMKAYIPLVGLSQNETYKIRAKYNGKVTSEEAEFTTEEALQLPNAGFEEWQNIKVQGKNGIGGLDIYESFPNNGESKFWDTRNPLTTSPRPSDGTWYYRAYSGTVQTPGYKGSAASISTIGWGKANTWTKYLGKKLDHKTAGMLFIGSYNCLSDPEKNGGVEILGREFSSRPTKISFYYKYAPYGGESFKVSVKLQNRNKEGDITILGKLDISSNKEQNSFLNTIENIEYYEDAIHMKPTHICIVFLSSDSSSPNTKEYQSGETLNGYGTSRHIGSTLSIDEIELIYNNDAKIIQR